jgi:hypothetical protein
LKRSTRYGIRVHPFAVQMRSDGRPRLPGGEVTAQSVYVRHLQGGPELRVRGTIRAWSRASARRLRLLALNSGGAFRSLLTLTYRARELAWEEQPSRNRRVVKRSKADLHRFLRCLRAELGLYLWVQEFQKRGVIHYHVLCTSEVSKERVGEVWTRASGQADDPDVLRHGVDVQETRSDRGVRDYVGRYVGKESQKNLPPGVDNAGRWWGASRSLKPIVLEEVVWLDTSDDVIRPRELRIRRDLCTYLRKAFGFKYRGGVIFDYAGGVTARLPGMVTRLRAHYGETDRPGVPAESSGTMYRGEVAS